MSRALLAAAGGLAALALVALTLLLVLHDRGGEAPGRPLPRPPLTLAALMTRFALLDERHSNQCGLNAQSLGSLAAHGSLQGACCSRMEFHHYIAQVRGLHRYRSLAEIPADPYDIPLSLARTLIGYDRTISLTSSEQQVYDKATRLAHEHGPCCCRCWRWSAFEGQAKDLIRRRQFSAKQIAALWDLEDGCGGPGDTTT